jgi:hypothetical protein
MFATRITIIKWLTMTEIKDCHRNVCPCADRLRILLVTRPKTNYDEINVNRQIKAQEIKYSKCSKN